MMFLKTPVIFALLALLIGPRVFADYPATVLASNPLAYYRFEEGPGATTLVDSSGNGLDIDNSIPVGTTLLGSDGAVGSAVTFNGDGYLVLPLNLDTSVGDFTIEAIIKRTAGAPEGVVIANQDGNLGPGRSNLVVNGDGLITTFSGGATTNSGIINTGEDFDHVILTFDQSAVAEGVDPTFRFFINGAEAGIGTAIPEAANGSWVIGANKRLNYQFFNGVVDDVAIYGSRLDDPNGDGDSSDSKIREHYIGFLSDSDDLNEDLVAYYPFNGNANDASGNGNDGVVNGATLTSDRFGNNTYLFEGNDYINFGDKLDIDDNAFTISVWLKPSANGVEVGIISKGQSSTSRPQESGYLIMLDNGKYVLRYNDDQARGLNSSASIENFNTWTHLVYRLSREDNNTTLKLFLNGEEVASDTGQVGSSNSEADLSFGVHNKQTFIDGFFKGNIDDVRIYNRALSEGEISSLYALEFHNSQFQIVEGNFTWQEAKADAEAKGGRLAVLDTQEKIDAANTYLEDLGEWPALWIGLNTEPNFQYRWINGDPLTANNWHSNAPSNEHASEGLYGYVYLYPNPQINGNLTAGTWDDTDGVEPYGYLLEILDQTPDLNEGLIALGDYSFENNSLNSGGWSNDLSPEWQDRDGRDNGGSFEEYIDGFAADGTDHIGLANGYYIWQDTGVSFEPNKTYQLTVGIGNRAAGFTLGGNVSVYAILNSAENLGLNGNLFSTSDVLLDPAVIAYETFDANINAPIGTFVDAAPLQFTTTDAVPAGTIVVLLGDNSASGRSHFDNVRLETFIIGDADQDGLPDKWEIKYGFSTSDNGSIDPNNGPNGDPDGDGLTNLEENEIGTSPIDSDSDGDGLSDAVEDSGGEFISLTQTGTNPLVADTDGDGLSDGIENPLLDFVDASQPGTDPNNEDSDKDGVNDGTEIGLGQNPTKFKIPTLELSNFYESAPNQPLEIDASNSSNQISGTTYQWYFNGFPIPPNFGGTSPQITFDGTSNSEGSWSVTATNSSGEETATLQYRVFVDTDLDGLSDYREQNLTGTNFELADTDGDGLNDKLEYEGVTNPNLADSDEDGLSDGVEINQTQTDPTIADTDQDGIVDGLDDQDGDGLSNKDEIEIYGTSPLLADTDGDSIDDKTELEILSDPNTATTTEELITIIRGMATIQSTDSDGDGLTDVKEAELESDSGTATTFYLGNVYDEAVESALVRGRGEVTSTPQNFNLISTAAYAALQVECDSRFLDTDGDGLTDQKEKELESDSSIETTFYLTEAYDEAVNSALISGRSEVTSSPQNFDLISTVAYNALQLQRDADLAAYSETLAQKDGVIGTLNNLITAKDTAYALVVTERDANLETYTATLAAKDGVIGTLNNSITAKDAAYALVVTERDRNLETYTATLAAKDGVIGTLNDSITTKDAAYVTVVAERDARPTLAAYETAVAESREAGQSDVTSAPATFGLFTSESYNMVIAERDARFVDTDKDGLTDVKEIELETDSTAETIFYLQDTYDLGVEWARFDGRSDVTNNPNAYSLVSNAQYNAVIAQRDARPTQVAFAKVIAERDARPTLGEVKDARLGSVVLQPDGANQSVKIRFSIEETDDFRTWIKRDGINEVTVPLEAGSKFYRFALQDE